MSSLTASPRRTPVAKYVRDLWSRREFATFLALGNMKARNASTSLGLFWWIFNPLLLAGVYWLVFGILIPGVSRDLGHLVSGLFVFEYTKSAMTGSGTAILNNSKLLVNLRFPRLVLPVAALIEAAFGFLAALAAFVVLALPFGASTSLRKLLVLPIVFVLHSVFNLGLGALTARWIIPFRDLNNLLPYLLRLWLYLSPIIYSVELIEARSPSLARIYELTNPLFPFLDLYRTAMIGDPFVMRSLALATAWTVLVAGLGIWSFVRIEGRMVKYL